jgi:acetyl esterase
MAAFDPAGPYEVTIDDIEYGGPEGERLLARIYRPAGAKRPLPALVDVHGGAWSYLDRTIDVYFDTKLAACGMIVMAPDFRQGPAHRYPTAVADIVAGIRFVKANAARLGAMRSPLGLIGGSSGGHLLLLAAVRPNAPEYATTPFDGQTGSPIDACVDYALPLWPIADPPARYRYLLDRIANPRPSKESMFLPDHLKFGHEAFFGDEVTMELASVPRIVAAREAEHLPPIWVAHPEFDENVTIEMSRRLVEVYRGAGGEAELALFPGVGHSFANFPGEAADRCIAAMKSFIGAQLSR